MKIFELVMSLVMGGKGGIVKKVRAFVEARAKEDADLRALAVGERDVIELPDDIASETEFVNFGQKFCVRGIVVEKVRGPKPAKP